MYSEDLSHKTGFSFLKDFLIDLTDNTLKNTYTVINTGMNAAINEFISCYKLIVDVMIG